MDINNMTNFNPDEHAQKVDPSFDPNKFASKKEETTGFLERLRLSFGSKAEMATKVEPKGIAEGFKQKGFFGGLKEMGSDIADVGGAAVTFGGAALGAVGGTVLGTPVGGVGGAAIGAGAGEAVRQAIGKGLGLRKKETPIEGIKKIGTEAALTFLGGKAGKYILSRLPNLLGLISGEGTDVIKIAMKNPKAADAGIMAGDDALRAVVDTGAEKSIQMKNSFISSHNIAFNNIVKEAGETIIDKQLVYNSFIDRLEKEGVKFAEDGMDFTLSKIQANPGEISKIKQTYEALSKWEDWSVGGVNKLKQLIGSLTRFADDAGLPSKSPLLGKFYNDVNDSIKNALPKKLEKAYIALNKKFTDNIDTFDDLIDAFHKGDPFTKLANSLSNNKDSLRRIIDFYEKETGESILATVAGRKLAEEKGSSFFMNPRAFLDFILSPEVQGKMITRTGKIINPIIDKASSAYKSYQKSITGEFEKLRDLTFTK